jgi:RimJ/RimL family protein N-acetyltransferase
MVLLTTSRLVLREFVEGDWPALHAVESRPEVARYQWFAPRTPDESRSYVAGVIERATAVPRYSFDLAVVLAAEERLIGIAGLGVVDPDLPEGMVCFNLHPALWGRGYATEAARTLVDYGFRELRLHRISANCDPANVASWRVLEKVGMRREGHLREHARSKGQLVDSLIYAVLQREWV